MARKWVDHSGNPCPSCAALAGQVHEDWPIQPKSERLYCGPSCHCTLDPTDEPESGDIAAAPLRKEQTMSTEHNITVHGRMTAGAAESRYEILFIHAGEANGYTFSQQSLIDSAPLWENCDVYVDHAMFGRSVRDLGGVLANVAYSPEFAGLIAELKPCGPSAEIVREAARIMLGAAPLPNLGFSADVIFSADAANNVEKIMQPLSVDLVVDPAFATKFIRQLNTKGVPTMAEQPKPAGADETTALRAVLEAQQIEAGKQLVDLKLRGAELPEAAAADVRARFSGKKFEPAELDSAVKAWQDSLAALDAPGAIKGPARITGMADSRDQFQAALDDLLGAPREKGAEALKVHALSGIREAYVAMTGDRDFVGGYFPDRVQFTHVAASFPGLLVNALNKSLQDHWQQLGRAGYDWWQKISTIEHFNSVQDISWLLVGTIGSLPTVAENGEYTELKIGDSKETSSFTKYGGYVGISLEAMDKDDTRKLRLIPRELANAGLRNISSLVAAIFTTASGAGPTLADTGALFNATAVTTKGGHKNLLTTALGTDYTAWNAVALAMYEQPMLLASEDGYWGTGKKCALWPKFVLVPAALKAQADALFVPRWASEVEAAIATKGGPTWGGRVEVVTVPEWTDATDWAAAQDPTLMPGIMIGERFGIMPQIFVAGSETDPAMFSNDESRIKVRHMLAVGVADFRPLHKENVAG